MRHSLHARQLERRRNVLAPCKVGKATLAAAIADAWDRNVTSFDLERAADLARLDEPSTALEPLKGLVVLEEIQRREDPFPTLRVLADRKRRRARFLILGSHGTSGGAAAGARAA